MDARYLKNVCEEMAPFFEEQGFKAGKNGEYNKDDIKIKIEYSDERQMYLLKKAGEDGEFSELSAWLFDDSQTERDAAAVGMDFTETLAQTLGLKKNSRLNRIVDMPVAKKDGADIATFAKKVLDVYPQFKEPYRAHIQKYGNFLYLNFFGETLVPQIKAVLSSGDKKAAKKLLPVLESTYVNGDKATVNAMLAVLAAAVCEDEAAQAGLNDLLSENNHMLKSVISLAPKFKTNKKLRAALVK